ncbi:heme exporter protein CcmD [Actinobacillus delphinicola]|uniref:Heme exporter protein D n=1 Tax=Actinobacillus delphinicola TaxID=51161 RepID=A0A448TUE6_9PAST|nr:heme exporter protein CcmD [Actinobacillus delphinicola]MDG6897737.1 heme exporter protein CcmD [Actinobacillus delphinicola]VEJ09619.1 Heme exporter protein CcmD [Actinobacillus delphinicola]
MFFHSWSDFINMGGYGFYVWLSYGLSFLAIILLIAEESWRRKALIKEMQRAEQREKRQKMRGSV